MLSLLHRLRSDSGWQHLMLLLVVLLLPHL
jgi:hypothetical protein